MKYIIKGLIIFVLISISPQISFANPFQNAWNVITDFTRSIFNSKPPADLDDISPSAATNVVNPFADDPNSSENVQGIVEKAEQSSCPQIGDLQEVTRCEEFNQFKETVDLCNNQPAKATGTTSSSGGVGTGN